MTALNAFQDEHFAYIGADSAAMNYDGTVAYVGLKLAALHEFNIAVAVSGAAVLVPILTAMRDALILDQADALKALEAGFLAVRKELKRARPQFEANGMNDTTMLAACYLEREARPAIFRIACSDSTYPGYPVNRWHEVEGFHFPGEIPAHIQQKGYVDDPIVDGRALFRAQRHHAFTGIEGGRAIGGTCSLFRVGRNGVDGWDILEFSDRVGNTINMFDRGVDVLRPMEMANI